MLRVPVVLRLSESVPTSGQSKEFQETHLDQRYSSDIISRVAEFEVPLPDYIDGSRVSRFA